MLKNATLLRKSAPWPPNISDEHVSCTAPATRNASLQILFKCPMPAIVFGNATKPSRCAHFWQGAQSLAPATQNTSEPSKVVRACSAFRILTWKCASPHNGVHFLNISTSKSALRLTCFAHFDLETCFAPQRRALFRHLNFQKCSGPVSFSRFWLPNALRATSACTFSTSQLPKVLLHVDLEMCFAPHRRALFRHHNFQKFYTCWLGNVLRATPACNFSSLIWPHGSAPAALASLHEPTFRPFGAINHSKNTVFRDFATFSRTCIFCLLALSLPWSSFSFSSLLWLFPPLLFICPYCWKFDF